MEDTRNRTESPASTSQDGSRPAGRGSAGGPMARFGLRAAALACIISTGGITAGLVSPINSASGPTDTTCCGNGHTSTVRYYA